MKKSTVFLAVCCASLLIACDKKEETSSPAKDANPVPALVSSASGSAEYMPQLAKDNNCTSCHAINKRVVGPAWMEVSKKYKGDAGAEAKLVAKVSKGGAGVWGTMPMPGNAPAVKEADIKELVKFILGLAK